MSNTKKKIKPARRIASFTKSLSQKKRITIVEDDAEMRNVFRLIFEEAGYEVELNADGKQVGKNSFPPPIFF